MKLLSVGALTVALLLAVADAPAPVPPPAHPDQATADCAARTYVADELVCDDDVLRGLDAELARLLALPEPGSLCRAERDAQRDWFRRRNLCVFETDARRCVEAAYRERLAALRARCGPGR